MSSSSLPPRDLLKTSSEPRKTLTKRQSDQKQKLQPNVFQPPPQIPARMDWSCYWSGFEGLDKWTFPWGGADWKLLGWEGQWEWRLDGVSTVRREALEVRRRRRRVLGGGAWLPPFREEGKTGQAKSPWGLWNKSLRQKNSKKDFFYLMSWSQLR